MFNLTSLIYFKKKKTDFMEKEKLLKSSICRGFLLLFIGLYFLACNDDKVKIITYDPSLPVTINSFVPDSGGVGTQLVIDGTNFGTDTSLIKVFVNGNEAKVIGVNDTHVYAVVPVRAGTGEVKVTMNKDVSITAPVAFNYKLQQNVLTVCKQMKMVIELMVTMKMLNFFTHII